MAGLTEYKCPCCGGAIEFNSKVQKMKCPYCDTEFEMDAVKEYGEALKEDRPNQLKWETDAAEEWQDAEKEGMRSYQCKSCGAEVIADSTTGAASCPYCGNPIVMSKQFSGMLKPDLVIPFQLDKKQAKEGLRRHLQDKKLLPKIFKDQNHIEEIKGIYVPFWIFEAKADADIRYKATRVRTWSDSDYNYTQTSHYFVLRSGTLNFSGIPVDGSVKMADDLMESIEPFDLTKAVDFQTAYLSGYLADKYDVSAEDSVQRANKRVKESTRRAFADTVTDYSTVHAENTSIRLQNGKARYALLPVWILNTTWNGEKYVFAMNGQTGKFVGNLPVDQGVYRRTFFSIAAVSAAAVYLLAFLIHLI